MKTFEAGQAKAQAQFSIYTDQCSFIHLEWDAQAQSSEVQAGHASPTI